jgi:uncharacterized protein YdeI (YjbR/CyaY-like superfamily)
MDDAPRFEPRSRADWRRWLERHHDSRSSVWLVLATKSSGRQRLTYDDVVEEALCFGWVDGTVRPFDRDRRLQYLARRKKGSTWARSNRERVERLRAAGLMRPAGEEAVARAVADGSWTALEPVEALQVPDDLAAAFDAFPLLRERYEAAASGVKRQVLWSLYGAKRPDTRERRLAELARRAKAGDSLVRE